MSNQREYEVSLDNLTGDWNFGSTYVGTLSRPKAKPGDMHVLRNVQLETYRGLYLGRAKLTVSGDEMQDNDKDSGAIWYFTSTSVRGLQTELVIDGRLVQVTSLQYVGKL